MSQIGDKIIKLRQKYNLTQKQFAEETGIGQGRLSAIELGKNLPSYETIKLIIDKYGLDANYFFSNENEIVYKKSSTESELITFIKCFMENNQIEGGGTKHNLSLLINSLNSHISSVENLTPKTSELLNNHEKKLLRNYRILSERDQGKVDKYVSLLAGMDESIEDFLDEKKSSDSKGKSSQLQIGSGEEAATKLA